MILSTLRRWLCLFLLTLVVSLLAASALSLTISMCADRTEATRLILLQRSSVERFLDRTSVQGPDELHIQPIGQQGLIQFKDRQERLQDLRHLFEDEELLDLEQMHDISIELATGCAAIVTEDSTLNAELALASRSYLTLTDRLLRRIELDNDYAFSLKKLWPVVALVAIAWLTAVFTVYIAVFNLSYGYDLFMRDYSKVD